ncbi:hypothetical protein EG68_12048 [Paragonimus skrjabini miyazakii]|uniref:C2H2-type domain-containing protein n=1 Tax=Paragonimus skrjabini miyazakii TaxID=59628 RepID=A0A8S9YDH6_9TREM|nr:hypothetical protein EG68_12048 [Paragonimus skrjabini miyazakii]
MHRSTIRPFKQIKLEPTVSLATSDRNSGQCDQSNGNTTRPSIILNETVPQVLGNSPPQLKVEHETSSEDSSDENTFKCTHPGCKRVFSSVSGLDKHSVVHRKEEAHICDYPKCGRRFLYSSDLTHHRQTHENKSEKYKCTYDNCGESFRTRLDLRTHSVVHRGDLPYECPNADCKMRFRFEGLLKRHELVHLDETKRPMYCCSKPGCDRLFLSRSGLVTHEETHKRDRKFKCAFSGCGSEFPFKSHLERHKLTHKSKRPTFCCFYRGCDKVFVRRDILQEHLKLHSEDCPQFECPHEGCDNKSTMATWTVNRQPMNNSFRKN